MTAILPALKIDSDRQVSKYFLPYQVAWIVDDSRKRLGKKSVRIGWTYGDAFKNVRKRLRLPRRDYLFATKDQPTAFEYIQTCYRFCEIYNVARSVISHGIEDFRVPRFDGNGNDTGFVDDIKVGVIKFDNGSRILAFSSNPNAMRAYGGDVGLDEFAFHPSPIELWAAASGRIRWGYDCGVWSSCNGDDTLHEEFCREAELGKGGWSYYKVTLPDAVEQGLVEKINQVSGSETSRTQFIENAKEDARLPEVYDQEYLCIARGGTNPIVAWSVIARCQQDYEIERLHLEEAQIMAAIGEFDRTSQTTRERDIATLLEQAFKETFARAAHHRLGFDVAASGQGDLASIYVDEKLATNAFQLRALFTCRTQDWHFLKTALFTFMRRLGSVTGCGDETGLGRQICWEAAKEFPNQFAPVNFRTEKANLGTALMNQLSASEKIFPRNQPDIAADIFALRKTYQGGKWIFAEGKNAYNPASHCDIAWSGALATKADENVESTAMNPASAMTTAHIGGRMANALARRTW